MGLNIGASLASTISGFGIYGITFNPTGSGSTIFVDYAPSKPDKVVVVTTTNNTFEMGLGMENERFSELLIQVRDINQVFAYETSQEIVNRLHAMRDGASWPTLDGGYFKVIYVHCSNTTFYGFDDNNYPTYFITVNVRWVED